MRTALVGLLGLFYSLAAPAQRPILLRTPLEQGMVLNGQRVGVWKYFDYPGRLGMEIDYETMRLLYFQPDSGMYVVQDGGLWTKQRLTRPCRPHGSGMSVIEHYQREIRVPFELQRRAKEKNSVIQTILTFDVDQNGNAGNPIVTGYTGFGMEKMMMETFEGAPNYWIPGVKVDGTPASCRFGITITICPDNCETVEPNSFRVLTGIKIARGEARIRPWTFSVEPTGIRFAPDNEWVLVDAKLMSNTGGNGFMVVPTKPNPLNQLTKYIPYGNIQNGYWLDKRKISFKYKYGMAGSQRGLYDLEKDSVQTLPDSLTYFDRISSDLTTLCTVEYKDKTSNVYLIDLATQQRKKLPIDPFLNPVPLAFSPDRRSIIFNGRKELKDFMYHLDLESGEAKQLPILNTELCGWSKDGSTVYVYRTNFPLTNYSGELFSIDLKSMTFKEVTGKVNELFYPEYSVAADQFLAIRSDDLYLFSPDNKKWEPIVKNVTAAHWSRDGRSIAYVSEKGTLLNLHDVATRQTIILHSQLPNKK